MPDKFPDKYRIPSARAAWWDYAQNGMYFVTICTAHREHYFGEIVKTPMSAVAPVGTTKLGVPTIRDIATATNKPQTGGKNEEWKPETLGVIINQYKRKCTIESRKIHADFQWQTRFHDHIIRDEKSFHAIRRYLINNPSTWEEDQLYS